MSDAGVVAPVPTRTKMQPRRVLPRRRAVNRFWHGQPAMVRVAALGAWAAAERLLTRPPGLCNRSLQKVPHLGLAHGHVNDVSKWAKQSSLNPSVPVVK